MYVYIWSQSGIWWHDVIQKYTSWKQLSQENKEEIDQLIKFDKSLINKILEKIGIIILREKEHFWYSFIARYKPHVRFWKLRYRFMSVVGHIWKSFWASS